MPQKRLVGKRCYDHLGGKLGAALLELYLSNGWMKAEQEEKKTVYSLTEEGAAAFARMGLQVDPEEL